MWIVPLLVLTLVRTQTLASSATAAPTRQIQGRVTSDDGQPLEGVIVAVGSPAVRAVTDGHGDFIVALATTAACPCLLTTSFPGYRTVEMTVALDGHAAIVTLSKARATFRATTKESAIAADPAAMSRISVSPLTVVRTAGTEADLMRELATMPGVSTVDGGTGLFVRGGDVSEVQVLFDGVVMNHPYRNETPTGGFRGAVDPFLTADTTFTTGGFAAPYGDALSAVVDLTPQDRPVATAMTATAGLAGVSFTAGQPLGAWSGFRVGLNRAMPSVLFSINPSAEPFDQFPGGWDASGAWYATTPGLGDLRVFVLRQVDHVGVQIQRDAFTGFLHSATSHTFVAAHWQKRVSAAWTASASAGTDRYASTEDAGVMQLNDVDANQSGRFDLSGRAGEWTIHTGLTFDRDVPNDAGTVPFVGNDFAGLAGAKSFVVTQKSATAGAFVDVIRSFGRVTPEVGVRADVVGNSRVWTLDPRSAMVFAITRNQRVRLALGQYHQAPPAQYVDRDSGTPSLAPMEAVHAIVGYEYGSPTGPSFLRIEAYDKRYRHLPLQIPTGFDSTGNGFARGVDVFVTHTWPNLTLRTNASWLVAARRWTPWDEENTYPVPAPGTWPPDFDIPYSFEAVATVKAPRGFSIELAERTAAGTPATPAIGAVLTPDGYTPVWGAINSERLPAYERVDLAVTRNVHVGRRPAVIFVSIDNVLDHDNVSSYVYSADYTTRTTVPSGSPRSVYVGLTIR